MEKLGDWPTAWSLFYAFKTHSYGLKINNPGRETSSMKQSCASGNTVHNIWTQFCTICMLAWFVKGEEHLHRLIIFYLFLSVRKCFWVSFFLQSTWKVDSAVCTDGAQLCSLHWWGQSFSFTRGNKNKPRVIDLQLTSWKDWKKPDLNHINSGRKHTTFVHWCSGATMRSNSNELIILADE